MIATPSHGRKLGLLAVSMTKARPPRHDLEAMGIVRDEIEQILVDSHFYSQTPFSWITLSLRYGLKDDERPRIGRVSKKYGDLPLSIEIDTHRILGANLDQLCAIFRDATLNSLIYVGDKYSCPTHTLKTKKAEQCDPPNGCPRHASC